MEGQCLTLSQVNKGVICESYLSHMGKESSLNEPFLRAQKVGVGGHCFPGTQRQHCLETKKVKSDLRAHH